MSLISCVLIVFQVSVSQSCKRHVFQCFWTMAPKENNALWWLRFQRIICRSSKCCTSLIILILAAQYPYMDIVVQSMYSVQFGLLKSLKSSVTVLEKTPHGSTRIHVTDGMQARGLESTWQRTSARWGWWRLMVDSGLEWGCIMMYLVIRWYISNISVGFITSWLVYCILHIIMCTVMTSD